MNKYFTFLLSLSLSSSVVAAGGLTLEQAVQQALTTDRWQQQSQLHAQALLEDATAQSQLPDPKLRIAMANLPTDSFDFDQENMTQLQLGVSQQFPRGDSLALKQSRLNKQAGAQRFQQQLRAAQVKRQVSKLWLKRYQIQQQQALLSQRMHIFTELETISRAKFRSGTLRRDQMLDASLKRTAVKDQLLNLEQQIAQLDAQLLRWLDQPVMGHNNRNTVLMVEPAMESLLPVSAKAEQEQALSQHPLLRQDREQIRMGDDSVALAEQAFKPAYKLDANYGYRADMPDGRDRADLFTVALTIDMPLLGGTRQDAGVKAAVYRREAVKERFHLNARQLKSGLENALASLAGLQQRQQLFDQRYLQQLRQQRRAAMQAYASSNADFISVAQAAMTELDKEMANLALNYEINQTVADINYFLAGIDPQIDQAAKASATTPATTPATDKEVTP